MKSMKKLVTLLLSLVMLCALAMPAMAAETTYSITINRAVAGHTYTAYQVFKGVYYKGSRQNGTPEDKEYLSDVEWGDGVDGTAIVTELKAPTTLEALRNKFSDVDASDTYAAEKVAYILQGLDDKSEELDEFARIVGKHLTTEASKTDVVATDATNVKIDNLAAGYYFVKDTGTINDGEIATKFLVKVVGDANVTVKAQAPTFDKKIVKENGDTANGTSANVGDKVTFQLTATVPDMASFDTYTFTISDTLSKGLTFDAASVAVHIGNTKLDAGTDYTLGDLDASKNTFTVTFTKDQLAKYVMHETGATIVVTYKATLNSNALTTDKETNKAYLKYTNDPSSDSSSTKTPDAPVYVYDFDLTVDKFDGTKNGTANANSKRLQGATFILYKVEGEGNNDKKLYYVQDKKTKTVTWTGTETGATKFTTDANGKATFEGLKEGTYYLEEITAPKGYNTLKDPVKVEIKASYNTDGTLNKNDVNFKLKQDDTKGNHYYQVQSIANKAGAVLPSTGGIGTTIFYVLGSILALGAAVLLIAKKRMNGQDR